MRAEKPGLKHPDHWDHSKSLPSGPNFSRTRGGPAAPRSGAPHSNDSLTASTSLTEPLRSCLWEWCPQHSHFVLSILSVALVFPVWPPMAVLKPSVKSSGHREEGHLQISNEIPNPLLLRELTRLTPTVGSAPSLLSTCPMAQWRKEVPG